MDKGFTLIELLVVIVVIGILISVSVNTTSGALASARDTERREDVASIARLLEDSYANQSSGSPSYPSQKTLITAIANDTGIAARADDGIFRQPGATGSSVKAATSTDRLSPAGSGTPDDNSYYYQAITANGGLCQDPSQTCVLFRLFYRNEVDGTVAIVKSEHQQ